MLNSSQLFGLLLPSVSISEVTHSSAAGAGLSNFRKEKPWRPPSLLLEADPPVHTRARDVVGPILAPPRCGRCE